MENSEMDIAEGLVASRRWGLGARTASIVAWFSIFLSFLAAIGEVLWYMLPTLYPFSPFPLPFVDTQPAPPSARVLLMDLLPVTILSASILSVTFGVWAWQKAPAKVALGMVIGGPLLMTLMNALLEYLSTPVIRIPF
ncbi:MAG: hypothetical protein LLG01_19505 [Planctomycetaceae bacterium]|nr:hypothetical protein [Planctomycetaceae bacterium]